MIVASFVISGLSLLLTVASVVQLRGQGWIERHSWVPYLVGRDGLTNRQRRRHADDAVRFAFRNSFT